MNTSEALTRVVRGEEILVPGKNARILIIEKLLDQVVNDFERLDKNKMENGNNLARIINYLEYQDYKLSNIRGGFQIGDLETHNLPVIPIGKTTDSDEVINASVAYAKELEKKNGTIAVISIGKDEKLQNLKQFAMVEIRRDNLVQTLGFKNFHVMLLGKVVDPSSDTCEMVVNVFQDYQNALQNRMKNSNYPLEVSVA